MTRVFEVMKAKEYGQRFVGDWHAHRVEPKLDGIRVIVLIDGRSMDVKFYSRNGRELTMFSHLDKSMRRIWKWLNRQNSEYRHGAMLDGEMCGSTFNEIGGAIHRKNHTEKTAEYHAFHAMPIRLFAAGKDTEDQIIRRIQLTAAINAVKPKKIHLVASKPVKGHKHCQRMFERFMANGLEGAMLKNMLAPWQAKRCRTWMKLKGQETEDLHIIGWKPGNGKFKGTLGAIICGREVRKGLSVTEVKVSVSGMDDDVRDQLFKMRKKLEYGKLVAEIEFQHVTSNGSLRHPRFIRLRRDKEK